MSEEKKSFVAPNPQTRVVAETKVLKVDKLNKLSTEKIQKIINSLLNNGYKPILVNNFIFVFARAFQIQVPQTEDTDESALPV